MDISCTCIGRVTYARVNDTNPDPFPGKAFLAKLVHLCHEMRGESIVPGLALNFLDIIRAPYPPSPGDVLIGKSIHFIWPDLLYARKTRKLSYMFVDTMKVLELYRHAPEEFMVYV